MSTARSCAALLLVFHLSGCAEHGGFVEKRGSLDEGLYYYETDLHGGQHPISEANEPDDANLKKRQPTRVPHPALVDRDSTIHVLVSPDRMAPSSRDSLFLERHEDVLKRKKNIQKALEDLHGVIEARKKAVELYEANDLNAFRDAKRTYGSLTVKFNTSLVNLWPKNTKEYRELNDAFDKPVFQKLQAFLMARITELEEEDRRIALRAESRRDAGLSLQVFLDSRGKERVPIHVEGYDLIDQLQLQKHDRFGLNLSTAEREALTAQMQATQAIAAAANKVRAGEISLEKALREAVRLVCPRLEEVLPDIESLSKKVREQPLEKRFDKTRKLLDQLVGRVKKERAELADQLGKDFQGMPATFLETFRQDANNYEGLISRVMTLCKKWKAPSQADIPSLIDEALQLYRQFDQLSWAKAVQDANDSAQWFVRQAFKMAGTDVQTALNHVLRSPEATELQDDLNTYYQDMRTAAEIVRKVQGILEITQEKPIDVGVREPSTLTIPLGEAKDTFVDLNYTPRTVGDTLTLYATLVEGNDSKAVKKDQTTASFKVDEFGYFARLSCAVVLAKPSDLEGGNDQFRFAPTLSWMHHYVPRPEDEQWFAPFMRTFRPSVGMHAAFLNFDTGDSGEAVQIGLGATLAFWENRLQFGAGYNLMADSNDDGRYYFFVGTDLIGLLQTVGLTGSHGEVRPQPSP